MFRMFDPLLGVHQLPVHHADPLFSKREAPDPLGARRRQPTFSSQASFSSPGRPVPGRPGPSSSGGVVNVSSGEAGFVPEPSARVLPKEGRLPRRDDLVSDGHGGTYAVVGGREGPVVAIRN